MKAFRFTFAIHLLTAPLLLLEVQHMGETIVSHISYFSIAFNGFSGNLINSNSYLPYKLLRRIQALVEAMSIIFVNKASRFFFYGYSPRTSQPISYADILQPHTCSFWWREVFHLQFCYLPNVSSELHWQLDWFVGCCL